MLCAKYQRGTCSDPECKFIHLNVLVGCQCKDHSHTSPLQSLSPAILRKLLSTTRHLPKRSASFSSRESAEMEATVPLHTLLRMNPWKWKMVHSWSSSLLWSPLSWTIMECRFLRDYSSRVDSRVWMPVRIRLSTDLTSTISPVHSSAQTWPVNRMLVLREDKSVLLPFR